MTLIDGTCTRCHRSTPHALTLRLTVTDPQAVTTHRSWRFCPDCLETLGILHGSDLALLSAIGMETIWDRQAASQARHDQALMETVATLGWDGLLATLVDAETSSRNAPACADPSLPPPIPWPSRHSPDPPRS